MKFGKKLQHQLEHTIPEWRPNFLSYKKLKKRLKKMGAPVAFTAVLDERAFLAPLVPSFSNPDTEGFTDGELGRGRKRRSPDITIFDLESKKSIPMPLESDVPTASVPDPAQMIRTVWHGTEEDNNFLRLVKVELHKFNAFFLEKEEEFLIRLDVLEERTRDVKENCERSGVGDGWTYQELIQVRKLIVTLHGEMVLLINYSSLNYIGLVKILKKHDKQTGANLRQSVLICVLHQPFFSTTNLEQLVEKCLKCEKSLRSIYPSPTDKEIVLPLDRPLNDAVESGPIPRQVEAALKTIQDMRRGS